MAPLSETTNSPNPKAKADKKGLFGGIMNVFTPRKSKDLVATAVDVADEPVKVPESVAMFFNGEPMAGKADKFMGEMVADSYTLEFVGAYVHQAVQGKKLDKAAFGAAAKNLLGSFPDLTFNFTKVAPKPNADGSWAADIVVMGTHTGEAFSPMPDKLPAIDKTDICVKIGPETFTLWTDVEGKICKCEITPLGEGHPHGPPGFYTEIGGVLPAPPPPAEPTFFTVVHKFVEGKAEGWWATMASLKPEDMKAMADTWHAKGLHNHSFLPTSADAPVKCLWESKDPAMSADDFQTFIDGEEGPGAGVFVNEVHKVLPGALLPTSYFATEAEAAPSESTGSFFWVYHTFKEGAAPKFWEMMQGMKPDDMAKMTEAFNGLGYHNHTFEPCALEGPCICVWESREVCDVATFQAFIDGPNGPPGGGEIFINEVRRVDMPGAKLPSAHFGKEVDTASTPSEFITELWTSVTASGKTKDAAKIDATFSKYFKSDCTLIRPSGNPLDMDGFKGMMGSADIIVESDVVASVDEVKELCGGNAAIVVFTTLSKFTYKGTANDDVAKFSATIEKGEDGAWKVAHLHRGTGQKPS